MKQCMNTNHLGDFTVVFLSNSINTAAMQTRETEITLVLFIVGGYLGFVHGYTC